MKSLPALHLKKGKENSVKRFHRWVFSGAVERSEGMLTEGELCSIFSSDGTFLASAHYQTGSITARILSFQPIHDRKTFYINAFYEAIRVRKSLNLPNEKTTIFRLIHGEGDGLPGLIVDVFGTTAVMQAHSVGMHKDREIISEALVASSGKNIQQVYYKSSSTLQGVPDVKDEFLTLHAEHSGMLVALENSIQFSVDIVHGQKTGFYIDQRFNRELLAKYAHGRKVLNTFCYSGGFSLYALKAGAASVTSVDSSKKAIEQLETNLSLNNFGQQHSSVCRDVMEYLKTETFDYDLVVLDPPAFAKNIRNRHNALQAYKRLNYSVISRIQKGGILFTFSCSQVVDALAFEGAVRAAAIDCGRQIRILHRMRQPEDHPVSLFHPEGEYLKGLVLEIH